MDLSVIIPSRNEKYLQNTIDSVLGAIEADTEIIVVLDGCWPEQPIPDNPRVTLIHHTESVGQRQSINEAARISRGKFIMKLDAHCAVGPGFDRILIEDWQPGWTMVPTMLNLDHTTWQPKRHKKTTAMYIGCDEGRMLRAEYYSRPPTFDTPVHETMCCMGPGWFLSAEDFWKQGGCDEGHGSWGQQGVEVSLKAWLSGGALMTDENCWFSHLFRGGGGPGFPYTITGTEVEAARQYSRDLWLGDKWPLATRTLRWLIEKFEPPGWEHVLEQERIDELSRTFYRHIHIQKREPTWRGVKVIKMPNDLLLYAQIIQECKPKWVIECGTKFGGTALFLQDVLDTVGDEGAVITIDKYPMEKVKDLRIHYIEDSSTNPATVEYIRRLIGDDTAMVILDSSHARVHVKWELHHYAPIVTSRQYLVVEDCYDRDAKKAGPGEAVDWFLSDQAGKGFEQTNLDRQYLVGFCRGGFLRRKA